MMPRMRDRGGEHHLKKKKNIRKVGEGRIKKEKKVKIKK